MTFHPSPLYAGERAGVRGRARHSPNSQRCAIRPAAPHPNPHPPVPGGGGKGGLRPWALLCLAPAAAISAPPATRPASTQPVNDQTLDWLLGQATTAPAAPATTAPSSHPAAPFVENDPQNKERALGIRHGFIRTSDGEKIVGRISTTLDKPLRVWDDQKKEYRDVPFPLVKTIDAQVVWERDEPEEWHFKESGSDIKEYTGKTYPPAKWNIR